MPSVDMNAVHDRVTYNDELGRALRRVQELEAELVRRLREFIVQPQVIITMIQFRSEPVFFVGAFRAVSLREFSSRNAATVRRSELIDFR